MAEFGTQGMEPAKVLPNISQLFCVLPVLEDSLETETSQAQLENLGDIWPYILGTEGGPHELNSYGLPRIKREAHIAFLRKSLERMPSAYTAMDPARPWVIYWALTALALLGQDVSEYRERVVATFAAAQNESGGFGGGDGQMSHVAATFAAVLSLAMVGGDTAFNVINRRAMWNWLGQLKDDDGGFRMAIGAELDARGVYCTMVIIGLLNLPLVLPPNARARHAGLTSFLDKTAEWVSRCQSYEGGISARPNGEAHAAYTYCGLACLCLLGNPKETLSRYLDMPLLIAWLSSRQLAPEGGFSGRTNKLVDSCYSHWVGGCWHFVQEALGSNDADKSIHEIWNKEGIVRYILCAAQNETGGMRDKPFKRPDGYHSCYSLAGLSAMQHEQMFVSTEVDQKNTLDNAFGWTVNKAKNVEEEHFFERQDLLEPLHPIFTIPYNAVRSFRERSLRMESF